MKKCNDECEPICDFCIHYHDDMEGIKGQGCAGEGTCDIDNKSVDIADLCDEFHCFRAGLEE